MQFVSRWNSAASVSPTLTLWLSLYFHLVAHCCESEAKTLADWVNNFVWHAVKTHFRPQGNNKPSTIFTTDQLCLIAFSNYYNSFSKKKNNNTLIKNCFSSHLQFSLPACNINKSLHKSGALKTQIWGVSFMYRSCCKMLHWPSPALNWYYCCCLASQYAP